MKINASLVVPLFNNEKTLVSQLKKCEAIMKDICKNYEIIVCDDKSTDSSSKLLKKYFIKKSEFKLFFHEKNQGIAKTIKSLYKKAKYPYVVLFSVDGDWEPNDIKRLLLYREKNHADIVIGKRTYKNYSSYRKLISFLYNLLPQLLFNINTVDAGSIKVIKRELIYATPIISKSVFFEAEFIIRNSKKNKKILSLPITFKKQKESKGLGGKFNLVLSSIKDLIKLRLQI